MTLSVPEDIAAAIEDLAINSGIPAERLLLDVLYAHFPPISAELQAEFDAWELASDEDMALLDTLGSNGVQ